MATESPSANNGSESSSKPKGVFLNGCRIDLPPDDVVEEIEFERFFRLNLTFGSLHDSVIDDGMGKRAPVRMEDLAPGADAIDVGALPIALYMPFTQQWKLDGYNRGRVVNSFTLGPGEEQTVEVFTWDRIKSSLESSMSFDTDQSTDVAPRWPARPSEARSTPSRATRIRRANRAEEQAHVRAAIRFLRVR